MPSSSLVRRRIQQPQLHPMQLHPSEQQSPIPVCFLLLQQQIVSLFYSLLQIQLTCIALQEISNRKNLQHPRHNHTVCLPKQRSQSLPVYPRQKQVCPRWKHYHSSSFQSAQSLLPWHPKQVGKSVTEIICPTHILFSSFFVFFPGAKLGRHFSAYNTLILVLSNYGNMPFHYFPVLLIYK